MTSPNERFAASEDPVVRVHRRQFVIGPRALTAGSGWRTIDLGDDRFLSADPDLRVETARDLDGTSWHLLGAAVDTRAERAAPVEELKRARSADAQRLYEAWTGRWVLVGGGRLHPDAVAMLSCYYGREASGGWWASSSPVLIKRALGIDEGPPAGKTPGAGWTPSPNATVTGAHRGISWYPPPHSEMPGVYRLLPSQVLDLRSGTVTARRLVAEVAAGAAQSDLINELAAALRVAVQRLLALSSTQPATLLLSGGRDSRMLLSAAVAAGAPLRTYTRVHRRASLADQLLPPKLARLAGYPHARRRQRVEVPGRRAAILAHSGYNVSWLSAEEFLRGGSDPLTGVALIGLCAELGRDRLLPDVPTDAITGRLIAEYFCEHNSPQLDAALDAWVRWYRDHPDPGVDLSDAFFLEQRTAGRKGAKEQICDLFPFERVPPLNSARLLGLINNFTEPVRRTASWIPELIARQDPRFLQDPMNPPDSYFGPFRGRLLNRRTYTRVADKIRRVIRRAAASR